MGKVISIPEWNHQAVKDVMAERARLREMALLLGDKELLKRCLKDGMPHQDIFEEEYGARLKRKMLRAMYS